MPKSAQRACERRQSVPAARADPRAGRERTRAGGRQRRAGPGRASGRCVACCRGAVGATGRRRVHGWWRCSKARRRDQAAALAGIDQERARVAADRLAAQLRPRSSPPRVTFVHPLRGPCTRASCPPPAPTAIAARLPKKDLAARSRVPTCCAASRRRPCRRRLAGRRGEARTVRRPRPSGCRGVGEPPPGLAAWRGSLLGEAEALARDPAAAAHLREALELERRPVHPGEDRRAARIAAGVGRPTAPLASTIDALPDLLRSGAAGHARDGACRHGLRRSAAGRRETRTTPAFVARAR